MSAAIFWTSIRLMNWKLYIAAIDESLCFVGSHNGTLQELEKWADSRFTDYSLVHDEDRLKPFSEQLSLYLQGRQSHFTLSFGYKGTPFQEAVWQALLEIPYGQTRTYSDIAASIQKPTAVRAVGAAIGSNPLLIVIPCHRVVGKNGALTGYRGGLSMKRRLLQLEQLVHEHAVNEQLVNVHS